MRPDLALFAAGQQTQQRCVRRQLVATSKARAIGSYRHLLEDRMADEAASHPVASKQRRLERQQRQQMIQVARQAGGALLAPRPRLRRPVMHPDQGPAGEAALQAQGEFRGSDGQHEIGLAALDLVCGLREPAPQAWQERQRLGHAAERQLLASETGSAGHSSPCAARPRPSNASSPGACWRSACDQPRADRIAPRLTGQQKDPARAPALLPPVNRPLCAGGETVHRWLVRSPADAVAGLCVVARNGWQANGNGRQRAARIAPPAATTPGASAARPSALTREPASSTADP